MTLDDILDDPRAVTAVMAAAAAAEILPRFQRLEAHQVDEKESGGVVTEADTLAELHIAKSLMALLPDSTTIGEEAADEDPEILDRLDGDQPVWIIDPVDGTRNFAAGKKCFAVIVALCRGGETIAGWIYDPLNDAAVHAVKGRGAWTGRQRLTLSPPRPLDQMTGSIGPRRRKRLADQAARDGTPQPKKALRYGCAGMEYYHLAEGTLDFSEYLSLKPWDHAAGVLIHGEAGGHSGHVTTGAPYVARAPYRGHLLMAPDRQSWEYLHKLFGPL